PDQIALEVEQVRLDVQGLDPERGIRPDADRGGAPGAVDERPARVDPPAREQQTRTRPEVRGREAEAVTPARAAHHGAVQEEPAAERDAGPLEIALRERVPDRGRRDAPPLDLDELHPFCGEPERRSPLDQQLDGPRGLVTEGE